MTTATQVANQGANITIQDSASDINENSFSAKDLRPSKMLLSLEVGGEIQHAPYEKLFSIGYKFWINRRFEQAIHVFKLLNRTHDQCSNEMKVFEHGPSVLVISPSEHRRAHYRRELEEQGYLVSTSAEDRLVLQQIRSHCFPLCIVETHLESAFVCWLLSQFNANDDLKDMPVIVISRQGTNAGTLNISRYPIARFYSSVPSTNELNRSIRYILTGARLRSLTAFGIDTFALRNDSLPPLQPG